MKNVIVLLGPTASGKTSLAINLAQEIGGEIISADSMQIYKYMDIGTAKPSVEERKGIPHHLIDEVYPSEEFSVARFKDSALHYIKKVMEGGKTPIVCGGTGLYINSLVHNIDFSEMNIDWTIRENLMAKEQEYGNGYLYEMLLEVDPASGKKLHKNDTKRIIRALEVYQQTGKTISYHQKISRSTPSEYQFSVFGLSVDREILYHRINQRVDKMMEEGLVEEVEKLKRLGYSEYRIPMQGIGYKEILAFLKGEFSLEGAVENIKQGTRRYGKRQITWFKRLENVSWLNPLILEEREILKKILRISCM
jgi:tRNA dimethylallyltransferase